MTNDWLTIIYGTLTAVFILGAIAALARMLTLASLWSVDGRRMSNAKLNRLYLATLVLGAAGFICWTIIESNRGSRAGLGAMALLLLIAGWRRSRAADASDMIAPVSFELPQVKKP